MPKPPDVKPDERCDTCLYWRRESAGWGACRRYPPQLAGASYQDRELAKGLGPLPGAFPLVQGAEWCGEWRAKG